MYGRKQEDDRRNKKLLDGPGERYRCGVWYDEEAGRYKRYYLQCKQVKKMCHRATRRKLDTKHGEICGNRGFFKRVYDYWWEIL